MQYLSSSSNNNYFVHQLFFVRFFRCDCGRRAYLVSPSLHKKPKGGSLSSLLTLTLTLELSRLDVFSIPSAFYSMPKASTALPTQYTFTKRDLIEEWRPSAPWKALLAAVLTFFNCANAAAALVARPKSTAAVSLASEVVKLASSLALLACGRTPPSAKDGQKCSTLFSLKNSAGLLAVAALYAIVNNFFMLSLRYMDVYDYQVLFSLRIPVTAALMYFILGKTFSARQRLAAFFLFCGALLSQADVRNLRWIRIPNQGLLYVSSMIVASSAAGVVYERILKNDVREVIHAKNAQLYLFGALINLATSMSLRDSSLFYDFSTSTWVLVFLLAAQGLVTSAVVKFADNMVKTTASVGSICASAIVAWAAFGSPLRPEILSGGVLTSASLALYLW